MRQDGLSVVLTASDLMGHLACQRLTSLDLAVALGHMEKPDARWDPSLEILRERGYEHERRYVDLLRQSGRQIRTVDGKGVSAQAVKVTRAAMREGAEVIVQAALADGRWEGRADVLKRVEAQTSLGNWGYEVVDTKLARETKAGTILQLCLYSQLVAAVQGGMPRFMHVVTPRTIEQPEVYATSDFLAYCNLVRARLEKAVATTEVEPAYPDPKAHCDLCRWSEACDARRRGDDHLCLVANISKLQIAELREHGVNSMAALGAAPTPWTWRPARGSAQSYERIREQARVQVQGRNEMRPVHEILPIEPGQGLARLPAPSDGDVFFDLEGDPFVGDGGLEYLFGCVYEDAGELRYRAEWALTRTEEKLAFEGLVDWLMERLKLYPDMHVYHYAPYEPGALKRLMGRYATREEEVDQLLRGERLVDLYAIVRRSIRASVESYSIKRLEIFYGFERTVPLRDANVALFAMQSRLELGDATAAAPDERAACPTSAPVRQNTRLEEWRISGSS